MRRGRAAALVAGLVVLAGCGLARGSADEQKPVAASPEPITSIEVVEPGTPEEPPPVEKKKATPSTKAKPKPTEDPNNFTLPECATREGKLVSKKQAKAALTTAAGRTYWKKSAPRLKVSTDLVKAISWQESGWQSNIVNCDGGRGLMQVMPDTVDQINFRFGEHYDATDYRQNAQAGANYLAWLTKAFGDQYFKGSYDLSPAKCRSHGSMCLLNMVISGYHVGPGGVDAAHESGELPNPAYVDSVRSLMKSCYCDRY
ncbi:lytic transglycosylase domain-containing protein [Actinoplanes sp. NPDC049265]|uniref:lytic transglycosylase domain-containing protein n=1 Tax=Actinoplanes sp. NPDC049265 TaxID=3363902 RepID=UPI00371BC178